MRITLAALVMLLVTGCRSIGYYAHVTHGQMALLHERRPISKVLADPKTPDTTRKRLALATEARRFASTRLDLPDNRSYTYFVQLDRPWVAWNVFATPELSVAPVTHCFPIAGCVAYRGYFRKDLADREAVRESALGHDVAIGEVPAYSTLGWFADPILSSMLRWDDDELAGTIFHELAHQKVYVKNDSSFNESFATFVEREGLREWRLSRHQPPPDGKGDALQRAFTQQVLALRDRLKAIYAQAWTDDAKRVAKAEAFEDFRGRYLAWRGDEAGGDHRYDRWMSRPLNNATLLPFGLYDTWVPSFATLFDESGRSWPAFFARVKTLSRLAPAERTLALERLASAASRAPAGGGRRRRDVTATPSASGPPCASGTP
ncbi:aminopeptidase [Luteibacter yeojuensis]|uniref:Aminopeptidase n=1 Tax=Luteibacter yeojuensis TaxID=345309 RepID=A0A7X5TP86_9GAMM|nr:aminopeptidase [Luteibacter yeojuensis]NID14449.1 aminopeptidase [Luteibacter yeojuensis]